MTNRHKDDIDTRLNRLIDTSFDYIKTFVARFFTHSIAASVRQSKTYLDRKEYQRAIEICNQIIPLYAGTIYFSPNLAIAHNNRGYAYFCLKQYEAALADYNQALAIDPKLVIAHYNRINVFLKNKDEQRALQATKALIAVLSRKAERQHAQGYTLFRLKYYEQALQHFQEALTLQSISSDRHYWVGIAYHRLKQYQQACQYLRQAICLNPTKAVYHVDIGVTYLRLKDYQQAMQHYSQALALDPKNIHARHNLGCILLSLNRIDEGRVSLRKALEFDRQLIHTIWMIEFCNLCFDPFDPAIVARLEQAAGMDVDLGDYLKDLCCGVALWLQQRYEEALASVELSLQKESDSEDASFWKGMTLAALGRNEEARAAFEWALEHDLPLCLFKTIRLLQPINEAFYEQFALPLLEHIY